MARRTAARAAFLGLRSSVTIRPPSRKPRA